MTRRGNFAVWTDTAEVPDAHMVLGHDGRMGEAGELDAKVEGLVGGVRLRSSGLAVAISIDGAVTVWLDPGRDALGRDSLFEIGSVTKTMTGAVLASAVLRGEMSLDTSVGDLLGRQAGRVARITVLQLATHTSGLPRLAPNQSVEGDDPADPYACFDETRLLAALDETEVSPVPTAYSNFGFQVLGYVLERALGTPLAELFRTRIFLPLGMTGSRCGVHEAGDDRLPGYDGDRVVPHWSLPLPGPGGVECSIDDLARYMTAMYHSPDEEFGAVVEFAASVHADGPTGQMGLGWVHVDGGWWHDGGTAGFSSLVGFHRPTRSAIALVINAGAASGVLQAHGMRIFNEIALERSGHAGTAPL